MNLTLSAPLKCRALLNGTTTPVPYDCAGEAREDYDPEKFNYIGYGHIVQPNGRVLESYDHFWQRKSEPTDDEYYDFEY